jgi:hypothetical protein
VAIPKEDLLQPTNKQKKEYPVKVVKLQKVADVKVKAEAAARAVDYLLKIKNAWKFRQAFFIGAIIGT